MIQPLERRLMMSRVQGVDVSKWQGVMNWTTAYNAGNRFAFAKATQGTSIVDEQFANNRINARNAGLLIGFYHFATPDSITDANGDGRYDDAVADANWFHAHAGAYMTAGYLRPVLDLESNSGGLTNPQLSKWANDFCWRIQQLTGHDPIVYCNTNWATNVYNSTVAVHDLWIANWNQTTYGNPLTSGSPPTGVWGSGNWDFWQYSADGNGQGAANGAQSSAIDLDVFKGNTNGADPFADLQLLKQNFVIGAPDIPTGPSPANGATNQPYSGLVLNWNDSPGAVAYDVYLDNMTTPVATNLTQSQWSAPLIAGGAHSWRVVAKGVISDDDTHVSSPTWTFTSSTLPLPGVPSGGTPNGGFVTTKPVVLDWQDSPNAATYDVYFGMNSMPTYSNLTQSQSPPINPLDIVVPWRVVARNPSGSTNGPQWSFTMDSTPPAAAYGAQTPSGGAAFLDFTVTYSDAGSGVDLASIDSSDITVTGPGGYSQSASLVAVDAGAGVSPRIATYRIDAPGGSWDAGDNGTYTVNQNASQVRDIAGSFRPAGAIDTFNVNLITSDPFAYKVGAVLHLDFSKAPAAIALATDGSTWSAQSATQVLDFTDVTDVVAIGTAGDDVLELTSGAHTFGSDLGAGAPNLSLVVAQGAVATLNASQRLRSLQVAGEVTLTSGGTKAILTRGLTIQSTGTLDLADNDLVIDYQSGGGLVGTSDGSTYSGLSGLIQAGFNGGSWDGSGGIVTRAADAAAGLTTLGIGEASDVLGLWGDDTALFGAVTVDATAVLIKYTYAGDANLDGLVSGDDYSAIDFNAAVPGAFAYFNGDLNYDGIISGDDYSVIDFNIAAQGAPL